AACHSLSLHDALPISAGAWDEHGHNLLPDLLAQRYFGDFEVLSFPGFTKLHSLELDLGEPYEGGPLWLLMHGETWERKHLEVSRSEEHTSELQSHLNL